MLVSIAVRQPTASRCNQLYNKDFAYDSKKDYFCNSQKIRDAKNID